MNIIGEKAHAAIIRQVTALLSDYEDTINDAFLNDVDTPLRLAFTASLSGDSESVGIATTLRFVPAVVKDTTDTDTICERQIDLPID